MDWREYYIRMALRIGPTLLVILSFVAILLGVIFHAISIDDHKFSSPPAHDFDPNVVIDDSPQDLLWFLQVTDLHISCRGNFGREKDFSEFATKYVEFVKPDAVLITGDITDGIVPNASINTGQQLKEWIDYRAAVDRSIDHNKNSTTWLDIRGNHDNFNVYRPEDPKTLYRQYSVQGKFHARNYMHIIEKEGKNYSFIGVDEVQTPGIKIFNFLGIVKKIDLDQLKGFKEIAKKYDSQYTVWFAHYPTSSIVSPHDEIRNIVDGPYLCGHFHTVANLVSKMHATQQSGFAEVELGDWKHERSLRLAAIDHQLFSLVDVKFRQLPIALMTNPKNAELSMPKYEPLDRIGKSTHIRVIAFSNATLINVAISIDGGSRTNLVNIKGPLYVLKWNPMDYSSGLHNAEIYVEDSEGKNMTYRQKFSLDSSKEDFSIGAKILLRVHFKSIVMTIFYFIVVVCVFPMICLRIITYNHCETGLKKHYRGTFLYNLQLVSNIDRLFWPLAMVPIWMAIGPQFIGRLVDEAVGVCFAWGVLVDGQYLHTAVTFNVSSIFLLFIHIPVTILITYQVSSTCKTITARNLHASMMNLRLMLHLALTALQLWMGSLLFSAYGAMALLTSFPFFWCIPIYSYSWFQCTTLQKKDFVKFDLSNNISDEREAFTSHKSRDDKSSTSDHSTC